MQGGHGLSGWLSVIPAVPMREAGGSALKEMGQWEQRWLRATLDSGKAEDPHPHAAPPCLSSLPQCQPDSAGPLRAATQPGAGQE